MMNFQTQGHVLTANAAGGVVISGNFASPRTSSGGNFASPRTSTATVRYPMAVSPNTQRAVSPHVMPQVQVAVKKVTSSPVISPRKSLTMTSSLPTLRLESTTRASVRNLNADDAYGKGVEVSMSEYRFRCSQVLGRGSYGEVWRAQVVSGPTGLQEVALKEVGCRNQSELQQAIFEVQVLLALERAAAPRSLRVPRCICYKVETSSNGWKVRTAMTVVPGESLDHFVRRAPPPGRTRLKAVQCGSALAAKLLMDIGPSLQILGPIAWHRDVNSHNILVDGVSDEVDDASVEERAVFWLIDFGLAVDSQSWVSESGKWRTEYIGGDSRYWPPSSWIMHLLGPEGFDSRPDLCEQYQRRLDVHGLGITAVELLCSVALACPPGEEELGPWAALFESWQSYRDKVWTWWAAVYQVFSAGGDLAPVQAKLVRDRIVDQLLVLLADMRSCLRACAISLPKREGMLLNMIADMLDEGKSFELSEIQEVLGGQVRLARSVSALMPSQAEAVQKPDRSATQVQRAVSTPSNVVTAQGALVSVAGPPPLQSQPAGCLSVTRLPWNGVPLPALGKKAEASCAQSVRSPAVLPAAGNVDPLSRTMRSPIEAEPDATPPSAWRPIQQRRDALMAKMEDIKAAFATQGFEEQLSALEEHLDLLWKVKIAKVLASTISKSQNGETARSNADAPNA
mmetsp:Transcript_71771/g.126711  ORF Transcript_71771/g.126711 Transcript_71771/m.126711 type:complete len:682 (+) Transcript_71771:99-2144(+)